MRFISFKLKDKEEFGIICKDGSVKSANSLGIKERTLLEFIQSGVNLDSIKDAQNEKGDIKFSDITLLAPIVRPYQDIICLGINYMAHAAESYKFKGKEFDGKRDEAVYFSKRVNEATAPNGEISSHSEVTNSLDYEVELGVILSLDARNVTSSEAKNFIFGYTILNDISARDIQNRHKQWYFGKSLDGFAPMGPCIVTADELDTKDLSVKCFVNGELRQNARTSELIFDENFVIAELSKGMTLRAGTIISMGTPSGVGMGFVPPKFLKSGDVIRCEIEHIGVLENKIVD